MVKYRDPVSRWTKIKRAGLVAACASGSLFYGWPVIPGLVDGAVQQFGRRGWRGELTSRFEDPVAYGLNITVRTAFALLFLTIAVVLWRQFRKDREL